MWVPRFLFLPPRRGLILRIAENSQWTLLKSAQCLLGSTVTILALNIHFYSSSSEKTLTQKSSQMMQPTVMKKKLLQLKPEGRNQRDRSEDLPGQNLSPAPSTEAFDHLLSSRFLIQKNLTQAFTRTRPKYQRCLTACSPCSTAKCLFLKQTFPCRVWTHPNLERAEHEEVPSLFPLSKQGE